MNALILVDLQNDFLPGGALAVREGDKIFPIVNQLLELPFDQIIATKDWHPPKHESFAATQGKKPGEVIQLEGIEQILWPPHCIQGTEGAEFAKGWNVGKIKKIFYKGTDKSVDSYSAFYDNAKRRSTGLDDYLRNLGIRNLFIAGLATDYCVKYTAFDAIELGYNIAVITDACRSVDLQKGDGQKALGEMEAIGVRLVHSKELLR